MKILGLDLQGTRLGHARLDGESLYDAGVVRLGEREVAGRKMHTTKRVVIAALYAHDARAHVSWLLRTWKPDVVAYEQVMRHGPGQVTSAHRWGAVEMAVLEVCHLAGVKVQPVGVCSAKLALAGSGKATKEEMVAAARARWPDAKVDWDAEDADAADAAGVAWSIEHPGESKASREKREAAERRAARRLD